MATEAPSDQPPKEVKVPVADFSELKHTSSDRIDKIIDGLTILLKSGKIVRLSSIDIPDFHIWDNAHYAEQAFKDLNTLLPEGTEVMLYQTRNAKKGRVNRMDQQLAHLFTKKEEVWIQGYLLAHGIARVNHAPNALEMNGQLLKAEQSARAEKLGIWADDSEYKLITPEESEELMGEFMVVEGIPKKIASVQNNIYLNYGQDWKTDFTVMISSAVRKKLAKEGIDPLSLASKPLRVRGWIRSYNGPLIELDNPAHLEILEKTTEEPLQNPQ